MRRVRGWLAAGALAALAAAARAQLLRSAPPPAPSLAELPATPWALQDAAFAAAGQRPLGADAAWIQLLQYAAGSLPGAPADPPGRPFDLLLPLTRRVTTLDPSFSRAYLYGAGILGWFRGVRRPGEAAELLADGVRRDPGEPLHRLYLAALAYQEKGDDARMIGLLEAAFDDPKTPPQMRAILANIYKERGDWARAEAAWRRILASPRGPGERARARLQLAELRRVRGSRRR